jgi:hypothetical protein
VREFVMFFTWAFLSRFIRDPVPEPDTDSLKSLNRDAIYEMWIRITEKARIIKNSRMFFFSKVL